MELMWAIIIGAFGTAYIVYGKKSQRYIFLVSGGIMLLYPYLVANLFLSLVIGVVLLLIPILWPDSF